MNRKSTLSLLVLTLAAFSLKAVEAGIFVGPITKPKAFSLGLTFGSGTFVPLIKTELEGGKIIDETGTLVTAAVKIRPKFGKFAPYGVLGVGVKFEKITFHFSEYRLITLIGGGFHLFPVSLLSMRFDIRLIHFSDLTRLRVTFGFFLHL